MPSPFVLISVMGVLAALSGPLSSATEPTTEPSAPGILAQVRQTLERLRAGLTRTERLRSEAEQALAQAEKALADTDREISANDKAVRNANRALADLEAQRSATERRVHQAQDEHARWLRALYFLAPVDYLKMLLNQEDPGQAGKLAGDYQYLMQRRGAEIAARQALLAELADTGRRMAQRRAELATLGARQGEARQLLAARKQERASALAVLEKQARSDAERIEELRRAEQRLSSVVEELRRARTSTDSPPEPVAVSRPAPADSAGAAFPPPRETLRPDELQAVMPEARTATNPEPDSPLAGFADLKGSLPLPLDQLPAFRFGQARPPGGLRAQGLVFHAEEGAPVRAVARGRVAYADWLKGFGLLLIVDHGDGYMSLYGHNRSTDKRVGERVEAGEVIATVGESGGLARPTLYFEIRHQGRPDDPLLWCRAP